MIFRPVLCIRKIFDWNIFHVEIFSKNSFVTGNACEKCSLCTCLHSTSPGGWPAQRTLSNSRAWSDLLQIFPVYSCIAKIQYFETSCVNAGDGFGGLWMTNACFGSGNPFRGWKYRWRAITTALLWQLVVTWTRITNSAVNTCWDNCLLLNMLRDKISCFEVIAKIFEQAKISRSLVPYMCVCVCVRACVCFLGGLEQMWCDQCSLVFFCF